MKLSCTKENLAQGLAITSHISTKNVNLPILNNVLMRVDGGGLKLISTNLEIAITCNVRGKVEQQGEYTIPSKLFFDFVTLLPNERVDIDLLDDAISVACGSAKTKIIGISSGEFPLVPPVSGGTKFSVGVDGFRKALSQTLFATATNESRPELSGVYMAFANEEDSKKTITLAATDSYRLAEAVVAVVDGSKTNTSVIVPQRTLSELNRVFAVFRDDVEAPDVVEIELADNQIVFRYGSVELTSRTIEGKYPDYKQIIPEKVITTTIVDRVGLVQAVKTASLFAKTGLFDVELSVNTDSGQLDLSASDATRGENKVSLDSEITGSENRITLNYRYLIDGVNAITSDRVALQLIDGANPCTILPHEKADEKYRYIVMPIRQ
ncbi:MAG: DNA polymerase III subunit beta [bacterium]